MVVLRSSSALPLHEALGSAPRQTAGSAVGADAHSTKIVEIGERTRKGVMSRARLAQRRARRGPHPPYGRAARRSMLVDAAADEWAPRFDEGAEPKGFMQRNALLLRNTTIGNFFDLCAVSVPIPRGAACRRLMLFARNGHDRRLLRIAAAVERGLRRLTRTPQRFE